MTNGRLAKKLALGFMLATMFLTTSAFAESKARIVRLSDVEGTVQIDRATGDGFEKAFLNLPIIEGSHLKTGNDGRAEVEFEDGSALRLGPDSEFEFKHLALGDDGQKISTVELVSGTAYASLREKKDDQFQLSFANESIIVPESAHFRVVLTGSSRATVAVFKGSLKAAGPSGRFDVAEKHSASIDLSYTDAANTDADKTDRAKADSAQPNAARSDAFVIAKNYEQDPLDGWDRQQNDYHDRYGSVRGSGFSSPYGYGVSDLNYYGNFMTLPGYGNVWQPFFTNAAWNPYMDGAWAWYPGAGYTFVSGYPWGWMPYRYGNWEFVPGYGWVWEPGLWNSWYAIPQMRNPPARTKVAAAPVSGHKTVMVGMGLMANPAGTPRKVSINPGSAGIGIPRGSVRHMDRYAKTMERTSRPVVIATQPPAQTGNSGFGSSSPSWRGAHSTSAPISSPHRSAAPSAHPH